MDRVQSKQRVGKKSRTIDFGDKLWTPEKLQVGEGSPLAGILDLGSSDLGTRFSNHDP